MAKVPMVARRGFRYNAQQLAVGDPFKAENMTDALLLERAGNAARETGEEKRSYRRRDLRAQH